MRVTALHNNNDKRRICDEILFVCFFFWWTLILISNSSELFMTHLRVTRPDITFLCPETLRHVLSKPRRCGSVWPTSHCETLGISSMVSPTLERYLESIWTIWPDHQDTRDRWSVGWSAGLHKNYWMDFHMHIRSQAYLGGWHLLLGLLWRRYALYRHSSCISL